MNQELEHLRLLGVFHYVVGGLLALFACLPIIHLVLGLVMILAPEKMTSHGSPPPQFLGVIFTIFGAGAVLVGWTVAACLIAAGRCLQQPRRYTFCFVMACVACAFMPFGTVLGVFTLMALSRPEVKALFAPAGAPLAPN
jgi:hypothetical protein